MDKKPCKKRLFWILASLAVLIILAALFLPSALWTTSTQKLNLAGYTILLPDSWVIKFDGETAVFYGEGAGNTPIGKARLINSETKNEELGRWFGFTNAPTNQKTVSAKKPLAVLAFNENERNLTLYSFSELPNPQPHHFAIYFDDKYVSEKTVNRILKSFYIPDSGETPPEKNISAKTPDELDAEDNVIYTIKTDAHSIVHNSSRLDEFIDNTKNKTNDKIFLYSYRQEGESLILLNMLCLDNYKKTTLLYKYYQTEDGVYSYSNNPKKVYAIAKNETEDKTTRYEAAFDKKSANTDVIFEYPLNPYQNKQELLMSYKGTLAGDNSAIGAILDLLPTDGFSRTGFSLKTDELPYEIVIDYEVSDLDLAYKDDAIYSAPFEKNAAVIFSLVDNVDKITANIKDGDKTLVVTHTRESAEGRFSGDVRSFAKEPKKFKNYLENVQNIPPETTTPVKDSGSVLGEAVYSRTVTIPSGMLVTHPRTGKKVVVDPYAKRFGYAQYLGKPITCVIYRSGTGYRAIASSGGAVLLEYSMADDNDKNYVISMINAYFG